MSMKISEPAAVPPVTAATPVPLPERLRERAGEGGRTPRSEEKQDTPACEAVLGAIANVPAPWQVPQAPLLQALAAAAEAGPVAAPALASQLMQVRPLQAEAHMPGGMRVGSEAAAAGPPATSVRATSVEAAMPVVKAETASTATSPAVVAAPPVSDAIAGVDRPADPSAVMAGEPEARAPVAVPTRMQQTRASHASEPARDALRGAEASQGAGAQAVPVTTAQPGSDVIGAEATTTALARHREVGHQAHRQQARAQAQVALQAAAQVARSADTATHFNVAFNSWGAGHAVVARLEQGRVHLQPSSRQVADALAGAAPLGEDVALLPVEAMDALDERTDERRRRRSRQNPS
jgi:hypothetical protein